MARPKVQPIIKWDISLSVGESEIDAQHQHLCDLLNTLNRKMKTGGGHNSADRLIHDLAEYALLHFRTEEDHMVKMDYPGLAEQKEEHESFSRQIIEFRENWEKRDALLNVKMLFYLRDWVAHHIVEVDLKLKPYFVKFYDHDGNEIYPHAPG